jgi:hypothetical protein
LFDMPVLCFIIKKNHKTYLWVRTSDYAR